MILAHEFAKVSFQRIKLNKHFRQQITNMDTIKMDTEYFVVV